MRGTRWPASRCLGFLRSTDARKLLSTVRIFPGLLTGYGPRDFRRNSDAKEFTLPWSIWRGSLLQQRSAQVVVEGQAPQEHGVPGHRAWNLFYEDARRAIHEAGFVEIVHADDLNGFREFEHNASVDSVMSEAKKCQTELHKWSKANQVSIDPAKEPVHIVFHAQPHGDSFKLLGVTWTCACGRR